MAGAAPRPSPVPPCLPNYRLWFPVPAPGRPRAHRAAWSRGFTILELLLALAIIALLAAVLIGGSAQLLSDRPASVDDVFWKAVQTARKSALASGREVRLTFVNDRDHGKEVVVDSGEAKQELPVSVTSVDTLEVTFLSTQKGGNAILVGGVVVETQPIPGATFYSDGTCTPFRVQVFSHGGAHIVAIDPWTCAPILTPPDPNAPSPS